MEAKLNKGDWHLFSVFLADVFVIVLHSHVEAFPFPSAVSVYIRPYNHIRQNEISLNLKHKQKRGNRS